jgi:hypothetical protein
VEKGRIEPHREAMKKLIEAVDRVADLRERPVRRRSSQACEDARMGRSVLQAADIDVELDRMRGRVDDLADAAAADLLRAGLPRGSDLVEALEARGRAGGPCADLLDQAASVPPWVDFELMERGARFGTRYPVQSGMALLLGSLVESYGFDLAAKVLVRSGRLESDTVRRLRDTSGFVLALAESRGARPGSAAHRHVVEVRMVHAFIRHGMARREDFRGEWGRPVNQEDYATTLLTFSHVWLRAMRALGASASEEEERAVHHLYRWVGHVMGVTEELLTATRDEERRLYAVITRRHLHPDDDSRLLAHALVKAMAGRAPLFLPRSVLYAISRELVGDRLADELGFPGTSSSPRIDRVVLAAARASGTATRTLGASPGLERVGLRLARVMGEWGLSA